MQATQEEIGSSQVYICGGTPRDRYLGHLENISDVDVTTGDKTIQYVSQEFGAKLGKKYNIVRKNFDDGHSAIHIGSFKMDFSSNFNVDGIEFILSKMGIQKSTEMQKEMFSRDFTCNALLLALDLRELTDPTHRGFADIKDRIIRTCLSPEITLTSNKNRVIRAVYLSSKLGFDIDPKIIEFVSKNPESAKISTEKVTAEKLNEAFKRDGDRAAHNISKMGIWEQIPITELVRPYYLKKDVLVSKKAYFQGGGGVNEPAPKKKKYKSDPAIVNQPRFEEPLYRNYDLYDTPGKHSPGAGWHSMQKYKSVAEFLEAKRKKLKDKYKADDSWIQDNGEITKKNPMKARAELLSQIIKQADHMMAPKEHGTKIYDWKNSPYQGVPKAPNKDSNNIDFPIDDQITSTIDHDGDLSNHSLEMGMALPLTMPDFEGKPPTELDFGRDYVEEDNIPVDHDLLEMLMDKYMNHEPTQELYGLPDGFDHSEEEDVAISELNPDYGTLGPESLMYEDKWNI